MLTKRLRSVFDKNNGILTLDQAVYYGLTKESLRKAHLRGDLEKLNGGIYLLDSSYSDELYTTQLRYSKGIYSHETAVMLHSLSTYSPFVYHLTFPRGYNLNNPEQQHIYPHHMTLTKINIGVKRSEEHTSELQSRGHLVFRLLLDKKKITVILIFIIIL